MNRNIEEHNSTVIMFEQINPASELKGDYKFGDAVVDVQLTPDGPVETYGAGIQTKDGFKLFDDHYYDWIATDLNGDCWIIADSIFKKTHGGNEIERGS